jgi:hypothetical protein
VAYVQNTDGTEILIPIKGGNVDLEVRKAWWSLGARYDEEGV